MRHDDPNSWMWSEAITILTRAERMHRNFFQPRAEARQAVWEPPADVLELDDEVLILVALPGIDPDQVDAAIDGECLLVAGRRPLPPQLRNAVIHRLELPQGRFERSIPLPPGHYASVQRSAANGCLIFGLRKVA
jgi:HSP20 family molecular chaperone IbpA